VETLYTDRMVLKPFEAADLDDLAALYADPDVMRYVFHGPVDRERSALALHRMMLHASQHGFGMWAMRSRPADVFLGRCGLQHVQDSHEIELGYTLVRRAWGRGLATEATREVLRHAFLELRLPRVIAVAEPENVASFRVMEKVGMHRAGPAVYYGEEVTLFEMVRAEAQSLLAPSEIPYG